MRVVPDIFQAYIKVEMLAAHVLSVLNIFHGDIVEKTNIKIRRLKEAYFTRTLQLQLMHGQVLSHVDQ